MIHTHDFHRNPTSIGLMLAAALVLLIAGRPQAQASPAARPPATRAFEPAVGHVVVPTRLEPGAIGDDIFGHFGILQDDYTRKPAYDV